MAFDRLTKENAADAVDWALAHGVAFRKSDHSSTHTAFSFTPSVIDADRFNYLKSSVPILGRLIHAVSEDHEFLEQAVAPIITGDPFFRALLMMHDEIHNSPEGPQRLPLLVMRSDFMDDAELGPKLIEFNGIAAGMGPFGQRISELHQYLSQNYRSTFKKWASHSEGQLAENPAIERLAHGFAAASMKVKAEFGDDGPPTFLMVVQENEDNVFDQRLLEYALQNSGIRTIRRTFRDLHGNLSSGANHRLLLEDIGPIDTVYLRAGYQYADYAAHDLDSQFCCDALIHARTFVEKHRVAINATVSQQIATSKRVQMLLSSSKAEELARFNLSLDEAKTVCDLLGEMIPVSNESVNTLKHSPNDQWVLKNQGEGGGHCYFGDDIHNKILSLSEDEHEAWSLMRRLHPIPRENPALLIRNGKLEQVDDLISEIGMFTVHLDGQADGEDLGYSGYLVRSKSAATTEGGVHSGMGALDSLAIKNRP
jgi:glutathione synthase